LLPGPVRASTYDAAVNSRGLFGSAVAAGGAIALFIVSLQTWYVIDVSKIPGGDRLVEQYAREAGFALSANAWEPRGFLSDLVMFGVIAGTLAAVGWVLAGGGRLAGTTVLMIGVVGVLQQLVHLLSTPSPAEIVDVRPVAWLGLLCALAIAAGGFLCLESQGGIRGRGRPASGRGGRSGSRGDAAPDSRN
jgi:hypothetical protein